MLSLTWPQVYAWRLEQQGLLPRFNGHNPEAGMLTAVKRMLGAQAQVDSAAELSIGTRVNGLARAGIQAALWQHRTLVKTWAMRGTIHFLAADDLPLISAVRCAGGGRHRLTDFLQSGFTEAQYDEYLQVIPAVLSEAGNAPLTREALANGVAARMNAPAVKQALLGSSWGTLWKPSMYRGDLAFGPREGGTKTFVNPRNWLKEWKEWDPQEARKELTRRYLQTYGPATPRDFSFWWDGGGSTFAKTMFDLLADEVETVSVEGWQATALKSTIESISQAKAEPSVRLLPMFDVYVLAHSRNLDALMAPEHKSKVFRAAAWVTAVVLVNGRVEGVWEYKTQKNETLLKVAMFAPPTATIRCEIEAEAQRLEGFLGTRVAVAFADVA